MDPLTLLAAYGGGVLALFILGAALLALWRMDDGQPLLLERVLRRQSDAAATNALGSGSRQFAVAVQRCLSCNEAAQCHAWLASGAKQGYETFCPNAGYVERIKQLAS
jgi:hypothetical protein